MTRRTLLYVMNADTPDHKISEAAESAAEREDHLICLIVGVSHSVPLYAYSALPYGGMDIAENWTDLIAATRLNHQDRADEVETLLAKSAVSGEVQPVICPTLEIKHHVARAARVSDEAYFADNLRNTPDILREAASGILFHSPIGFRLNGPPSLNPERIFVAWDSSEAAASAVHFALPHLKQAQEVVIACIDPIMTLQHDGPDPGTDMGAWLSHHGCHVTVSQIPSGGHGVGKCIQDHAQGFGADLVVMGAYGHARMLQTVLGGTTRAMLDQTELAVFMGH